VTVHLAVAPDWDVIPVMASLGVIAPIGGLRVSEASRRIDL
jgi:hypothetical protein